MLFSQITEIVDPEPHAAALNMALDEALLQHATRPTLRLYRWAQPAVSFGYFGPFADAHRAAAGRELVRRWTGGGVVEHGEDLTYTLVVPRAADFLRHPPLESYRLVHEQIASWLGDLGLAARVAPAAAERTSSACFEGHVRHDLLVGSGKVAGAAQRRTKWGLLHQGSIQLPRSTGHRDHAVLADRNPLAKFFAGDVERAEITPRLEEAARQIARDRYATDAWLRKF